MGIPGYRITNKLLHKGFCFILLVFCAHSTMAGETIRSQLESTLVPGPVEYALIAPAGFEKMKDLPLILNLHGGQGDREGLIRQQPIWDEMWASKQIAPAIVVMPSVTKRGFYMNFKDGSEKWEDFIISEFLPHLRDTYPVSNDPRHTFIMGVSMGGMGALRMAFKYPEKFGAVAGLEPGIEPILAFDDMKPKHRFWRSEDVFQRAYGKPVDKAFWAANNPANIARTNRENIISSGIQIYIDAGDEDQFWLYEGAEFLHQMLWQERIKHEYHLIRGADHVGPSLNKRTSEAALFLFRSLDPWEQTGRMKALDRLLAPLKKQTAGREHYAEQP